MVSNTGQWYRHDEPLINVGEPSEAELISFWKDSPPKESSAIIFQGYLYGIPVRILLDCGATRNYVSADFIAEHKLKLLKLDSFSVEMADGSTRECLGQLHRASVKIGKYRDKLTFDATKLQSGFDVVLGMPWLAQRNPDVNWTARELQLQYKNELIVLRADNHSPAVKGLVSAKTFERYLKKGEQCYSISVHESTFDIGKFQNTLSSDVDTATFDNPVVEKLLRSYKGVFPCDLVGLGPEDRVTHEIKVAEGCRPVHRAPHRMSVAHEEELQKRLQELVKAGHIRPSKSPWAAPVLFTPKKDGGLRFCVDYRGLNSVTERDQHPLPIPEDQFRRLNGSQIFSKIDLRSGYYQVRIAEEDVPKTAFTTAFGLFEFTVMPFGLTNAPATFMRLMQDVFSDYINKFMVVYLDDILIYSQSAAEHAKHVELVLQRLKEKQLFAKLSKCSFFQEEVEFCGLVVSNKGVSMAEDKVHAITDWPIPRSTTAVRSFLGLTGFYRQFIKDYSQIALPMTELTKKDILSPGHCHNKTLLIS